MIPAYNEEGHIEQTVLALVECLNAGGVRHEILVVNDNSTDRTGAILATLQVSHPTLRVIDNAPPNGFGFAVRRGLASFRGDTVAIVMADGSDQATDVVACYRVLQEGYDCVFGSRFIRGGKAHDYPWLKLILNRLGNKFIQYLFRLECNDISNAFKLYRRRVIAGIQPLLAVHFNLTVELPLKAVGRGFRYATVPITWHNRKEGVSKFKIKEMGSRYFFIVLYCWLERALSRGDYKNAETLWATQLQVWPR